MTKTKQILITGVAGFIGSNLAEALLKKGYKVSGIDNLSTGKKENIEEIQQQFPGFKFTEGDIRNADLLNEVIPGHDIILHQAALGSVPRSIKDPATTIDVNITGTTNVFYAAYKHNVKRVVYAASSSTYGDSEELPKVEHKIGKPLSPYAISKYVNELLAENFHRIYGINLIGLRYFNVFGRRQDPASTYAAVIPKFVSQLMRHESPTINGDGQFSRDFTYIKNVVQANELAATTENPKAINQVYNVACGEKTSLSELFEMIKNELTQFDKTIAKIEANYGPTRKGDIPHSLASIELARNLLGYDPEYNVKNGLKEAIYWYWKNL